MHTDPYADPRFVDLRHERGASLCADPECNLSGGHAHVGPCEPCRCPMEHAVDECPEGREFEARVFVARKNQLPPE